VRIGLIAFGWKMGDSGKVQDGETVRNERPVDSEWGI
jgi:hypothetical protein